MSAQLPNDVIPVEAVHRDLDAINTDVLALLERGKALIADADAALTDEARAAGRVVAYSPGTPGTANPDGGLGDPGTTAGYVPVTDEEWARLRGRLTFLGKLVKLLDEPIGNATYSYAELIRAGGRRWRTG